MKKKPTMATQKNSFEEVERLLQEIGAKIEELIEKAAKASGKAKKDIEKKISEMEFEKEHLEKEFYTQRDKFEKAFSEKRKTMEPELRKAGEHIEIAAKHLASAFKSLFSN
jgi:predicted  nucleic acid-binding Zn-ribbon protein